ncbi:D-alanyl-D-alanine carboxypeptidase [uncultured Deinococcus sp.]|uniref:D-alanyl-D-alanine carboxypeptidase n=1 Tax=uncultured Deinococcus sp. TaxID=158789 RepID=UPI0025EB2BC3|nr:D-alanyl-D-alanine carboxypeptidase [uncultured Deinococcus sp.]
MTASVLLRCAAALAALTLLLVPGASTPVSQPEVVALTLHRAAAPDPAVRAALRGLPQGVRTGLHVIDLTTGHVLDELDPDTALIPASLMKVVTAAGVLTDRGGAGGWWSTELTVPAAQVGQARVTTLTLRGSGDPTLEATHGPYSLRALAVQARAHGLRSVARVRLEDQTLEGQAWADGPLGVPMPALTLAGWQGDLPTDAASARQRLGRALIAELRRAGVSVGSEVVESAPVEASATVPVAVPGDGAGDTSSPPEPLARRPEQGIASVRSGSPTAVLAATLRPSDNLLAEALLATLARRPAAPGRHADALTRLRATLRRMHVDLSGVSLHDGSGLDRRNRLTPRAVTTLLQTLYDVPYPAPGTAAQPADVYRTRRNAFAELLPQAGTGETVPRHDGRGGTLALRLRGSGLDVRAKTGTLPGVSALAGYVTGHSGHTLAFAVIMNGPPSSPILTLRAVQDEFVRALASAY